MSLEPAGFVPYTLIQSAPLTHIWDDWNPYAPLGEVNPDTEAALQRLTPNACLTFAIGCAEWVVGRVAPYLDDARPFDFLEAAWAFEMSRTFRAPPESNEAEWKGPVRGAADLALMTILNVAYAIEDDSAHIDAAFAELIPLHVISPKEPFIEWRAKTLVRLSVLAPVDTASSLGSGVPREALDPTVPLDSASAQRLVEKFLAGLDPRKNPFLKLASLPS